MSDENETRVVSIRQTGETTRMLLPQAESQVPAGFPSPADDGREGLDIAAYLVRRPESTYFVRVSGDSMTGACIFDGDLLIVDRSLDARSGDIVIAVLDGEFTVKRLRRDGGRIELLPENPRFRKITIDEGTELEIWGVVTGSVRRFR